MFGIAGLLYCHAVLAQTPADRHVREIAYLPNAVVDVPSRPGFATHIILDPDESIVDAATGDSEHWSVVARHGDHHVYLKPLADAQASNLLVTTDRRSYAFALTLAAAHAAPHAVYVVVFTYPGKSDTSTTPIVVSSENRAYSYQASAHAASIVPAGAYDDRVFTYLTMAQNSPVPAVFARADDGSESMVNSHMDGDTIVLHGVFRQLVLRLGDSVVGVWNDGQKENPQKLSRESPPVNAP